MYLDYADAYQSRAVQRCPAANESNALHVHAIGLACAPPQQLLRLRLVRFGFWVVLVNTANR